MCTGASDRLQGPRPSSRCRVHDACRRERAPMTGPVDLGHFQGVSSVGRSERRSTGWALGHRCGTARCCSHKRFAPQVGRGSPTWCPGGQGTGGSCEAMSIVKGCSRHRRVVGESRGVECGVAFVDLNETSSEEALVATDHGSRCQGRYFGAKDRCGIVVAAGDRSKQHLDVRRGTHGEDPPRRTGWPHPAPGDAGALSPGTPGCPLSGAPPMRSGSRDPSPSAGRHWSCADTAKGQRTDPEDTDVLQPGHEAAAFRASEVSQMTLVGR